MEIFPTTAVFQVVVNCDISPQVTPTNHTSWILVTVGVNPPILQHLGGPIMVPNGDLRGN